jgi:hypothetical protein
MAGDLRLTRRVASVQSVRRAMTNSTWTILKGENPDYFRNTPFEFERTAVSCYSFVVIVGVAEPAGSSLVTANPVGAQQEEPNWVPMPLNV